MKKLVSLTLAALMMCQTAFAGDISVSLNGENVEFKSQSPVIVEGRTLIPLRGVFEKLGYEISWDNETKTAIFTKEGTTVKVSVNAESFTVNDSAVTLDVPAQIINGSMMLPLRAVGEASGLSVDWDNDTKTVKLLSDSEETTELTTETTTEKTTENKSSANSSNIPADELEALQSAARCFVTLYSVAAMYGSFLDTESYNIYKVDGGMKYSYSEKEMKKIFDDAITECEKFKSVSANIKTGSMDSKLVKRFSEMVDSCIDDYKFMRDMLCTDKYDDLTEEQVEAKVKGSVDSMFASKALLYTEMESVNDSAGEIASSEKYNSPDDSKLSASVKKQKEAYCKEIGTTVNKYTVFLKEYDDASKNPDKFIKAADAIRDKLNSTKTPAVCTLDREIMLICCDLLEQAGNDVKTGALEDDGKNEKYIEFTYSLAAFEQLVKDILGDNYELKFIEESDDEEKSEEEKKIEENIEGKYV